jgi:hypothetical protein
VRVRALAGLACAIAAVALAACGDDDKTTGSGEGAEPSGTSSVTTTAAPTSTAPTTTPTATTGVPVGGVTTGETTPTSTGESGEGGAGDEEPARVPVALTHSDGALSPTTVTVPAFLTLEIRISGAPTTATLPGGGRLTAPGTKTIAGLKPGKYTISTADGGRTTLDVVNGGDPGP